ncbi:MAG: nucleoside diphosphate kinase regulator [Novosphingobium sp.]
MTRNTARRRPPIDMIDTEADALTNLAMGVEDRLPEVSGMLLDEIARARICSAQKIGADVVTMHSTVEFSDEASGAKRTVQLVYPKDADIAANRISILTPIGAGLIGLRQGQSIIWPDRSGHERVLRIDRVQQGSEIAENE